MTLGYPASGMVNGFELKGQRSTLGSGLGFELYQCLLFIIIITIIVVVVVFRFTLIYVKV